MSIGAARSTRQAKGTSASTSGRERPGGRAARVVESILGATISELARVGYDMLRVDDVADAARVNKTTIYRRWPTKIDLVAAAIRTANWGLSFMPDTGSVRSDLLALLDAHAEKSKSVELRGLTRAFLGEIAPELARLVQALRAEYRERWIEVVRRGIARGELPAATRVDLLTELITSVSAVRHMRNDAPLAVDAREQMVDLVLAGATVLATTAARGSTRSSSARVKPAGGAALAARLRSTRSAARTNAT